MESQRRKENSKRERTFHLRKVDLGKVARFMMENHGKLLLLWQERACEEGLYQAQGLVRKERYKSFFCML